MHHLGRRTPAAAGTAIDLEPANKGETRCEWGLRPIGSRIEGSLTAHDAGRDTSVPSATFRAQK